MKRRVVGIARGGCVDHVGGSGECACIQHDCSFDWLGIGLGPSSSSS